MLLRLYSLNLLYNKDYKPSNIHRWIFYIWAYQSNTLGCVHWHRGVYDPPTHKVFIYLSYLLFPGVWSAELLHTKEKAKPPVPLSTADRIFTVVLMTCPKPWFWLKVRVRIKRTPYSNVMPELLECPVWGGACWVWIRVDLNPEGERTEQSPAGWLVNLGSVNLIL